MSEDGEDKSKEESQPKKDLSMRGIQQGGIVKCPRCGQEFASFEEYKQHSANCRCSMSR